MNKAEFVNMIECGDDIMFTVGEQGFTIITWPDDGPIVGEWNKPGTEKQFETPTALVDGFEINGVALAELIPSINITSYTRVKE